MKNILVNCASPIPNPSPPIPSFTSFFFPPLVLISFVFELLRTKFADGLIYMIVGKASQICSEEFWFAYCCIIVTNLAYFIISLLIAQFCELALAEKILWGGVIFVPHASASMLCLFVCVSCMCLLYHVCVCLYLYLRVGLSIHKFPFEKHQTWSAKCDRHHLYVRCICMLVCLSINFHSGIIKVGV